MATAKTNFFGELISETGDLTGQLADAWVQSKIARIKHVDEQREAWQQQPQTTAAAGGIQLDAKTLAIGGAAIAGLLVLMYAVR